MAANDLPIPVSISPSRIKRLIERLSYDTALRQKFEKSAQELHGYKDLRSIDPEFPGPFSHYYLSLQYLLHDPRAKNLYDQYYKYLNNPQTLAYVCSQLALKNDVMGDLDKGIFFEKSDSQVIESVLVTPGDHEAKIAEVLEKIVKEKTEKKRQENSALSSGSQGSSRPNYIPKVSTAPQLEHLERASTTPALPKPSLNIPKTETATSFQTQQTSNAPKNPASFKIKQINSLFGPSFLNIGKQISHAGFIFYKRHPISTRVLLSGSLGGIISVIFQIPLNPGSGMLLGAIAGEVAKKGFDVLSPPPVSEPEFEDDVSESAAEGSGGQRATSPGGLSLSNLRGLGQGMTRPSRLMGNAFPAARNLRSAATLLRAAPLLGTPGIIALAIIGFLLLLFLLLFFLPPLSLLPPFADPTNPNSSSKNFIVKKTGPVSAEKYTTGDKITYTITVTYTGSDLGTATVVDTLPADTTYDQANPPGVASGNTVKWTLSGLVPQKPTTITLEVRANKNISDIWMVNSVDVLGSGTSGNTGVGGVCPTPEEIKANRADRNTCQGFNAAIQLLGATVSEEQIQKYISENVGNRNAAEFERKTRFIVEKSMQSGINPIIIMGLWKTESGFTNSFGCDPHGGSFPTFEDQVECATGIRPGGAVAIQCAVTKDANSKACVTASQIVKSPNNAHVYYGPYIPQIPITTFDDFMKLYGPFSPKLGDSSDGLNNNCIHSYNTLVEFAIDMNACNPTSTSVATVTSGALASCKFYRNDQQGADCPPNDQGFRCEQAIEFKSQLLLNHIATASQKTGVPQEVLAAFARVESTVPLKYSATKKSYSISDYSDADVQQMKNPITTNGDIDATIGNTNKAICPRSTTGALGLMQIQPPQHVHDQVIASIKANNAKRSVQYDVPNPGQPSESLPAGLDKGAIAIGKTLNTLTVDDFCDPQKSMIMASHVFFGKMKMTSWTPPTDVAGYERFMNELARLYYGEDGQTGAYGNSVWRSVSSCKPTN